MPQKQPKNPNVIRATVCKDTYDYYGDMHIIQCVDDQANEIELYFHHCDIMKVKSTTNKVTLWRGMNCKIMYIAYDDYIVEHAHSGQTKLDAATQKHFDNYKRNADARLKMRARLDEIIQKVAIIKAINAQSDAAADAAKKTLTDFLLAQAASLREKLAKRR